jgi:hypothetical protein
MASFRLGTLVRCVSHCQERSDVAIRRQERAFLNIAPPRHFSR